MADGAREGAFNTVIFDTGLVRIGAFRCHPDHPSFPDTGPSPDYCFVFPRTAVEIEHERARPFVANPNIVTFYNEAQPYRRGAVSPAGDCCDWFAVDPALARDTVRALDASVDDRPERPFRLTHAASDPPTYLLQRKLFDAAASGRGDPLWIEEQVVHLLDRVLRGSHPPPPPTDAHRDAVLHVERLLSLHWDRRLRLRHLAREAQLSVFHLCRVFRHATGRTIHQYCADLRTRSTLETLRDRRARLVDLALASGFSSHSHFSAAFRRAFGETPSTFRARF